MDVREKLVEFLADFYGCDPMYYDVDALAIAQHLITHGVTVQEWISVDERLPEDNDRVIAFRPNEPEISAYKYCIMWGWSVKVSLKQHSRGITHWMPIPQPPKGE